MALTQEQIIEKKHRDRGYNLVRAIRYAASKGVNIKALQKASRNLYIQPDGKYTTNNKHYPVRITTRESALSI